MNSYLIFGLLAVITAFMIAYSYEKNRRVKAEQAARLQDGTLQFQKASDALKAAQAVRKEKEVSFEQAKENFLERADASVLKLPPKK
jgi:flagellar biosynthesis/type III secretory pathway M-ring protein FliF/YscJ